MTKAEPTLDVAEGFSMPLQVVTDTIGILGKRGSGKSNVAVRLAEEMFDAGLPWVAIDPKGDWWGIRSSEDGAGPGLPIPVFGGLHGDVDIEASVGALVADLIVDENLTAVLDVSDFSKGERAKFLVAFFDRLYNRHRRDPHPRHVFLEEAHEYIPQSVGREEGKLKEAAAKLVLQGRTFGLGSSCCSQRSARIHKDVLTQIDTLIAMRTTGPQDRKAIEAWVHEHDVDGTLVSSLPNLDAGEGWVWSPSFMNVIERVRFHRRRTFDSGSTPVHGKARKVSTIADVDTEAIAAAMAETIERAKADDPRELKKRVRQLEQELKKRPTAEPEKVEVEVEVVKEIVPPEMLKWLEGWAESFWQDVREQITKYSNENAKTALVRREPRLPVRKKAPAAEQKKPAVSPPLSVVRLGKRERLILQVLAQYPQGRSHRQISMLTGYSPKASTIGAGLSALRKLGYVEGSGDSVRATQEGIDVLGDDLEPLPQGPDLLAYWRNKLGSRERKFLDVLIDAYPDTVGHDEMADLTDYSREASTVGAGMSKLRGLEIADGWKLHDDFWEAIS